MERTDKEIIEAMTFIKEQHNGELPYKFGSFECAKMMAKYLKHQLLIQRVSKSSCEHSHIAWEGKPLKIICQNCGMEVDKKDVC
jgi:hypothetical protein